MSAKMQEMQLRIVHLEQENDKLKKEQEEFQQALIEKVKEIEASPKMWRWFRYGKLLFDLIQVIKDSVEAAKSKS